MNTVKIEGRLRTGIGKKAARHIRSEGSGNVLGVIYGGEKEVHFYAPILDFRNIVYTPDFKIVDISVDGKTYNCILKDKQFDPVTDTLIHVDFLELVPGKKVIANLPVKLEGQSAGVKAGGRLEQKINRVKVRTTPEHLKEYFIIDITKLKLNENLRIEDLASKEPDFEFMQPARQPIASIVLTRALKQAESGADSVEEGEETSEAATEGGESATNEQK